MVAHKIRGVFSFDRKGCESKKYLLKDSQCVFIVWVWINMEIKNTSIIPNFAVDVMNAPESIHLTVWFKRPDGCAHKTINSQRRHILFSFG